MLTHAKSMEYAVIGKRVFDGEILSFPLDAAFIRHARQLCRDVFEMQNPTHAHKNYSKEEFLKRADLIQKEFNSTHYKNLLAQCLRKIEVNTDDLYWDTLGMRIAPPIEKIQGGFRSSIGVHRDTWGAGIQQQINWWAPIWSLASKRTMAIYPAYWDKPLKNTTADWSFQDYLASRRKVADGHAATYPSAPSAIEMPTEKGMPLLPRCGQILAFSAAQLHSSIPNTTTLTRFSLEIRTISKDDICQDKKAPNVDCQSYPPLYRLFKSINNQETFQLSTN